MKNILLLILAVAISITSCRKDEFKKDTTVIVLPSGNDVTTTVNGFVKTDINSPVADAEVQVGGQSATTDENGYFIIPDVRVDSEGLVATVNSVFHTTNIVRATPIGDSDTYMEIYLNYEDRNSNFLSLEGGEVSDTLLGVSINIPPNSMEDEFGNSYVGEVYASVYWFDPSNDFSLRNMPGNLEGIDKEGNKVTLGTLGMFSAEFRTEEGQDLNLKPDMTAMVTMNIPGEMIEGSPDEVPLWSLDEEFGVWVEEGIAYKEGNKYIFDVSHFSFWNCDAPYPVTNLEGTVTDSEGNAISNVAMNISFFDGVRFISRAGYTNDSGQYGGKVPKGHELALSIESSSCAGLLYQQVIGPFTDDVNQHDVVIDSSPEAFNISGVIVDCFGDVLSTGTIFLKNGNGLVLKSTLTDENGSFEFLNNCEGNNFTITATDYTTFKSSTPILLEDLFEDIELDPIFLCDDLIHYVDVKSGIGDLLFINPDVYSGPNDTLLVSEENGEGYVSIFIGNPEIGLNDFVFVNLTIGTSSLSCGGDCSLEVDLKVLNFDLKIAEGTVTGEMIDENANFVNVDIEFKVKLE